MVRSFVPSMHWSLPKIYGSSKDYVKASSNTDEARTSCKFPVVVFPHTVCNCVATKASRRKPNSTAREKKCVEMHSKGCTGVSVYTNLCLLGRI